MSTEELNLKWKQAMAGELAARTEKTIEVSNDSEKTPVFAWAMPCVAITGVVAGVTYFSMMKRDFKQDDHFASLIDEE